MQNPITFMPTEPSGNTVKQVKNSINSDETKPNSFKQVLSKEISEKRSTGQEKAENKVEEKAVPKDIKKNISSQPTKIEPIAEEESKTDDVPPENAQTNGVQLIALVESLAQYSPKITEKTTAVSSAEVSSIESNTTNPPLSNTANVINLAAEKNNQKIDPKIDPKEIIQNKFAVGSQQFTENTPVAAGDNTLDSSSSAERLIAATQKGNEGKSEKLPEIMTNAGMELSAELKASLQDAPKTDINVNMKQDPKTALKTGLIADPKIILNTDLNGNFKTDPKIDLKPDLKTEFSVSTQIDPKLDSKVDLIVDLKLDLKTELEVEPKVDSKADPKVDLKTNMSVNLTEAPKANLKTDLKVQDPGNSKEQSVKIADIAPSAQNFAQQVAVSSAQINATAEVPHLAPRVGTPAWNQSVGQKIVWMVAGGQQTAELTLNPPDLGPMQVVLSVNNDQANATFISAHPDVRDALESAMPKLRQMMNDAGVQLSGFSVKSESSNPGAQFSGDRSSSHTKNDGAKPKGDMNAVTAPKSTVRSSSGNGIVDTFA